MKITIYPEAKDIPIFEEMLHKAGMDSMDTLATRALLLFEWAVDMVEEGQRVGALHKAKNEWMEITLPGMYLASRIASVKAKNRIVDAGNKTVVFSYDMPKQNKKGGIHKAIVLQLQDVCAEILQDMMDKAGLKDSTQVLGYALGLYHWALGKVEEGYTMGSLLEAKKLWTDLSPAITVVKHH